MLQPTTVNTKGQVTIPIHFRKKMNIRSGTKINFLEEGGRIVLDPIPDFLKLRGSVKTTLKYDKKRAQKAIAEYITEEWKRKEKRF
ncbi:MAG TPA: AbrB/MazE/SpoVT family DNA-binding domain-containing protein [Patescibacteria group bacterium]|nr:AbrB/MazE/SpoVT family DNA-binding domain-containing protein [Patescibacteria group bacterium]